MTIQADISYYMFHNPHDTPLQIRTFFQSYDYKASTIDSCIKKHRKKYGRGPWSKKEIPQDFKFPPPRDNVSTLLLEDPFASIRAKKPKQFTPQPGVVSTKSGNVITIDRPSEDCSFEKFCEKYSYPRYGGLFTWQKECYNKTHRAKFSKINAPRDHGKSIYLGNLCQYRMDVKNWDVLYLGWTDRRKEVAEFIYNYFEANELMSGGGGAAGSPNSPFHFTTLRGNKFDTYEITSRKILGMHALGKVEGEEERKLLLIIDDPIDETFRDEPHKETKVETKWRSTISNINPDQIIFTGTKKFKGDFFNFLDETYSKLEDELVSYVRRTHLCTPYIEGLDIYKDVDWTRISPEEYDTMKEKARAHPCYNPDIECCDTRYKLWAPPEENILCPERWTEEKLNQKRLEIGEYWWFAEYEQDPRPITGYVFDELEYIRILDNWKQYDYGMIVVDSATATMATKAGTPMDKKLKDNSMTGLVVILRHVDGYYDVVFDETDYYEFEEKLYRISELFEWLRTRYTGMPVKVVIEKQGGGDSIISSATYRKSVAWKGKEIKIRWRFHIIDIHQTRDKIMRIDDYLRGPINTKKMRFLFNLRKSHLVDQISHFPYSELLDAIDALATGMKAFEEKIKGQTPEEVKQKVEFIRSRRMQRYEQEWTRKNQQPWVKKRQRSI